MKLKNFRPPKLSPLLARQFRFPTHKDFARGIADFLNHNFADQGWNLPDGVQVACRFVPGSNPGTDAGRARIRKDHEKLKALVAPALDAFAEGKTAADEFERLVFAFNELDGHPYQFERRAVDGKLSDEWERNPAKMVEVKSLYDYYLARLAELFDGGKLDYLARCRHCDNFFVTAGRGKPALYAPGHRNDVSNEKLREEGYFQRRYQEQVNEALAAARKNWKRGLRNEALIEQLRKEGFRIGKTLLRRNKMWTQRY